MLRNASLPNLRVRRVPVSWVDGDDVDSREKAVQGKEGGRRADFVDVA